ncbi:cingulin [Biomphalaria glabrata]|nr:cingulin [Biomphalaria glabrata]
MALNTCKLLQLSYGESFCLPVEIEKEQDTFTIDAGWIAGAFFLGLIVGIAIVAILTKPFLNALKKKKHQDEEKLLGKTGSAEIIVAKDDNEKKRKGASKSTNDKKTFKFLRFWRKKPKSVAGNKKEEITEDDVDPALLRGMVEVMQQTNSLNAEIEMAEQDMTTIISNERSIEEEKETIMLKTLDLLLKKKAEKRAASYNFYVNFMKKTDAEVKELTKIIQREKEEAEEKIRNDPKLSKDTQTQEDELQKMYTFYNNKQKKLQKENKNKIRQELLRSSGMPESEIDDIMEKLANNLAAVEQKIGLEQARQKRALDQRLAKRKRDLEFKALEDKELETDMDTRVQVLKKILTKSLKDDNRNENQIEDIVTEYSKELDAIHKEFTKEFQDRCDEKYELLRKNRLMLAYKLLKKQEKEKQSFLQSAEKSTNTAETKQYHELMIKHHMEQEELCEELDENEIKEIAKLKQSMIKEEARAMDRETEKLEEKLENLPRFVASDVDRILKLHREHMSDYKGRKQREKQAIMARLQEKLQQRISEANQAEAYDLKEQEMLKEEQMLTVSKVLAINMDLTEDAKNRILKEHEQNMQVLSNQLLTSKLRQQKSLEIKFNQRKVRLMNLKQKQEELTRSTKQDKKSDLEQLADEIAKEEDTLEAEKKKLISELRQQLAKETEEALKLQDDELSLSIGRLQVGQARRKAILKNQDQTLKQLQEDLDRKMSSGVSLPSSLTDQIIQQHYNQMNYLNEQLQQRRKRQEKSILEKLRVKKEKMEEDIETQLEEKAQEEYTTQQRRGAGFASLALMQVYLDQRHAKAMQDLETEMYAELEKSKNELNTQLEEQLKKDLELQHKDLLSQLADVSKMSKADLQDAFSATSTGKRDNISANRLANDIREGIRDFPNSNKRMSRETRPSQPPTKTNNKRYDDDSLSEEMSDGSTGF